MQATLIYNGNSGGAEATSVDKLEQALTDAGFDPVYRETREESDLDKVLDGITGLVVAAGGDGTIHAVARRLLHNHKDVALAILPMGTANNIAKSLELKGDPEALLKGLKNPRKRPLDVGHVEAPWGEAYFFEAAGFGLFADMLADYDPEKGKSVLRAADTLKDVLVNYDARDWQIKLDDRDLSARYVAVEILNMQATGPRLKLAPEADPGDGKFNITCVTEPEGLGLLDYVKGLATDSFPELENVEAFEGQTLELAWQGDPIHLDDTVYPREATGSDNSKTNNIAQEGTIIFKNLRNALTLWLPEAEPDEET